MCVCVCVCMCVVCVCVCVVCVCVRSTFLTSNDRLETRVCIIIANVC